MSSREKSLICKMARLEEMELVPPIEFPFPFEPYSIQKDFMRELYVTLERGQVGIFESPTGTGKSLSIICGALKWLLDREKKDKNILTAVLEGRLPPSATAVGTLLQFQNASMQPSSVVETTKKEPDWFALYDQKKAEKEALQRVRDEVERKERCKARLKKLREENAAAVRWKAKRKREHSPTFAEVGAAAASRAGVEAEDADIVVAEYCSDEEEETRAQKSDGEEEEEAIEEDYIRKIFYCSRTHTQLAQFVREVQKSPYSDEIQVITLGSRQNLCINPEVTHLKSLTMMNDRCLDMQKSKTTKDAEKKRSKDGQAKKKQQRKGSAGAQTSCPYYKLEPLETFRDLALTKVQDIEQLVVSGREVKACPYYGVRRAIPAAQLVVLPYSTLLHAPTREAVGVSVRGNVVIIDEAHNLLDAISSVYSSRITGSHVAKAYSQLSQYMEKYRSRLKAKNLMYINQILQVLNSFLKVLQVASKTAGGLGKQEETKLVRLNDFLFTSNMDNINIFKILQYCKKSQISKKLNGFVDRYFDEVKVNSQGAGTQPETSAGTPAGGGEGGHQQMKSPLMLIEGFLKTLTNMDANGRIIITKKENLSASSLKFLLLNPSVQFAHIVKEASAVVVTGGTMHPANELKDQLLAECGLSASRLVEFTCGHVIPDDHLLPLVLCKGPAGEDLEFSFQTRDRDTVVSELGRSLVNLSAIVPGGVVCFFPSYDYENKVYTHWAKTGILDKLKQRKKVFREPKLASQVDHVLSQYSSHIQRCDAAGVGSGTDGCGQKGAIMLCVVGGKLSEGINFSDDLGRCVVMVGLPYPNITSPELKEKMAYLNSTMSRHSDGRLPGQVHYENLCMKAVNQSIGRAIRHSEDYACILLVDARYGRHSVNKQLPHWISKQLQVCKTFGPAFATVRKFFNAKKAEK